MSSDESVGEIDENNLEIIEQGEDVEETENRFHNAGASEDNDAEAQDDAENKKTVKPKRVIKNPQPKLNERTLQESRGLSALPGHFDRVKFNGQGYEERDLNVLLKTYEYWCHRLIPKFSFDDCLARLETLGSKKVTQTQIKRIRMGINFDTNDQVLNGDDNEEGNVCFVDKGNNQFDQLLTSGDELLSTSAPRLSEEQMERIRQNKERAQKLREERLRIIKQKTQRNLQPSDQLMHQIDQLSSTPSSNLSNDYATAFPSTSTDSILVDKLDFGDIETNIEPGKTDGEDDIDNILDFINADEELISVKNRTILPESDSEDHIDASKDVCKRRRCIIESDEDDFDDKNKSSNHHKRMDNNENQNMNT